MFCFSLIYCLGRFVLLFKPFCEDTCIYVYIFEGRFIYNRSDTPSASPVICQSHFPPWENKGRHWESKDKVYQKGRMEDRQGDITAWKLNTQNTPADKKKGSQPPKQTPYAPSYMPISRPPKTKTPHRIKENRKIKIYHPITDAACGNRLCMSVPASTSLYNRNQDRNCDTADNLPPRAHDLCSRCWRIGAFLGVFVWYGFWGLVLCLGREVDV